MRFATGASPSVGIYGSPIAGVVTSTALFYGDVRYTLPAVPSLVLFAAAALPGLHKKTE